MREKPTQQHVRDKFIYDPETGEFFRRDSGKPAGTHSSKGYKLLYVCGTNCVASRIAWLYQAGEWPSRNIVFIDGDKSNCRWANLREAGNQDVLSFERVREVFDYDPETGKLFYRRNRGGVRLSGDEAGVIYPPSHHRGIGYPSVGFNGEEHLVHRIIWLWWHGQIPDGEIDHINGVRHDNRISNLRIATRQQNNANKGRQRNNTSGYKGVARIKSNGKWRATIQSTHLGCFHTPEEAHAAYAAEAVKRFGEFARLY